MSSHRSAAAIGRVRPAPRRRGRPVAAVGATTLAIIASGLLAAPVAAAAGPAFTSQPGGTVYNQPFAPEAAIAIKDGGTVVATATGTVTMSILAGTGTPGALLTCTGSGPGGVTFTLVNGATVATGCAIDRAGTGYRLAATWNQGGTALSAPFDIRVGPPAKLGFATQPAGAMEGRAFGTQPVVEIEDAAGQRVATASGPVTLSIASGTGTGGALIACAGGLTVTAVAGVAPFSGCAIDRNGTGFALSAASPGLAPGTSATFGVASPVPAGLGFVVQPARGTPSGPLAVQPVVAIQDANGLTILTAPSVTVTLTMGMNPGAGSLSCAGGLSRTTVNGVATFSGCTVNRVGPGYSLLAFSTGLTAATSAAFDVSDRIAFTQQPTAATAGEPFAVAPVVAIGAGPSYTATHDQGTPVTLAIKPGTGAPGAILTCESGLRRTGINGLVTFGSCAIDRPGSGYVLTAVASGLGTTVSAPFSVAPGVFTVVPSASVLTWGSSVTLSIDFRPKDGSGAGRTMSLMASRDGFIWYSLATVTTNSAGHASFTYRPACNLVYRAVFAGTVDLAGAISPTTRVVVRQTALLRPTSGGSVTTIRRGTAITFATTIRPAQPDLPIPTATFFFYRRIGDLWTLVAKRVVTASAAGVARTTWTFQVAGDWYVRSVANATPYDAASALTPPERYSVW